MTRKSSWRPGAADIEHFQTHGWLVTPGILADEVLDNAAYGAQRHYAGERDYQLPLSGGFLDWRPEHGPGIRLNDYVSLQNDQLSELVRTPALAAIAATLSASPAIRLFHDQLVCKPPGQDDVVGWHVDHVYWKTCTEPDRMLTAWVPFEDVTADNGTLTVIDKSHLWPDNDWMKTFGEQDLPMLEERIDTQGSPLVRVPLEMARGQVSFHHSNTIHGGLSNRSDRARIALAIHFQPATNRYLPAADDSRTLHINDLMCRRNGDGEPDYCDPNICPLLYDSGASARG